MWDMHTLHYATKITHYFTHSLRIVLIAGPWHGFSFDTWNKGRILLVAGSSCSNATSPICCRWFADTDVCLDHLNLTKRKSSGLNVCLWASQCRSAYAFISDWAFFFRICRISCRSDSSWFRTCWLWSWKHSGTGRVVRDYRQPETQTNLWQTDLQCHSVQCKHRPQSLGLSCTKHRRFCWCVLLTISIYHHFVDDTQWTGVTLCR
jgi:hypothetical protein